MKKRYFILLFFFLFSFAPQSWNLSHYCSAQEIKIDSLLMVVKKQLHDTNEVKALNLLSEKIGWRVGNIDTALHLANQALKLSNLLDYKQGRSRAFGNIGLSYQMEGNYPLALKYYFLTTKIREELNDKKGLAIIINNIGNVYNFQSNYTEALKYYFKALKIREEIKDKRGISDAYTCIGNVYFHQLNFNEALQYHFKALEIKKEINEKIGLAYVYGNIGNVYVDQKKYTEALKHFNLSLNICKEIADTSGILLNYDNMGICYIELNEYEKALPNYQLMYNIASKLDYKWDIASSLINMGLIYFKQHKLMLAKESVLKGLPIAKELNVLDLISEGYNYLMLIEEASGNYKEALDYNILYNAYKDSLFSAEKAKSVVQQQMQYDFDKQRTADSIKVDEEKRLREIRFSEEKKLNQLIIISGFVVLIIVSFFSILIYNRFRITKRQNKIIAQQKIEVENQKLIVESQKSLVEEKHKEITDSINYAVRIQRALLASKQILDANLKEYFVFFKPKDIVSGDFYWASHTLGENGHSNFALVTADSTGHGVPGAIMSILNIACLNEAVKEGYKMPNEILDRTRSEVIKVLQRDGSVEGGKDGMDCSLCIYDFKNMMLWVAAANNPVWIVRTSATSTDVHAGDTQNNTNLPELIELKPDKMPIGKHDKQDIPFKLQQIKLQKDDVIYTITDGFPDQFGGVEGKKFKVKKLRELLVSISSLPLSEQYQIIESTFNNWVGSNEQIDDVTIIGVRV